jgi:hypothetical protein
MIERKQTLANKDGRPTGLAVSACSAPGLTTREARRFVRDLHQLDFDRLGTVAAYCLQRMADMKR